MANNPYQHPQTMDNPAPEARVSALAVCSLVFGIMCCIPGSGLLATILGGAGMVRISRSEGRLSGRTLSFIGLALGILSTAAWLAILVGGAQVLSAAKARIFVPVETDLRALERGDWATARKLLDSKVAAKVSDQQLETFRDQVGQKFGAFVGVPSQVDWNNVFSQPTASQRGTRVEIPFPVEFKNGQARIILVTDSPDTVFDILLSGKSIDGAVSNIGVKSEGKEVWLLDTTSKSSAPALPPSTPKAPEKSSGG